MLRCVPTRKITYNMGRNFAVALRLSIADGLETFCLPDPRPMGNIDHDTPYKMPRSVVCEA